MTANATRTVLIAGIAPGLGEALKARFEAEGYAVAGVSRGAAPPWSADLGDPDAVAALFERLDATMPPLAGVVHNAMRFHRQPFAATDAATMQSVWRSTVLSAFNVAQHAVARMVRGGGGTLILSGASGSRRAGAGFAAFSSAKFALRGLAQAIAREHGRDGVHVVHVVIDGLIRSARTAERFAQADAGRMIEPDDLAALYVSLLRQPRNAWTHELDVGPAAPG